MIQLFICSHVSHEIMSIIILTNLIIWLFTLSHLIISLLLIRHTPLHCNVLKCSTIISPLLIPWKFWDILPIIWPYLTNCQKHLPIKYMVGFFKIIYVYHISMTIFQQIIMTCINGIPENIVSHSLFISNYLFNISNTWFPTIIWMQGFMNLGKPSCQSFILQASSMLQPS